MRQSYLGILLLSIGAVLCRVLPAHADVINLAPHERTFQSAFGSFTVGNRNETLNRIAPLNMVGTSREALVSNVAYGKVDGIAGGSLKTGYHVGCSVNLNNGTGGLAGQAFVSPPWGVGIPPNPQTFGGGNAWNITPSINLNLAPGEIKEVPVADKDLLPGNTVSIVVRDFHITVNGCAGPVAIRQYTYVYAKSATVDDSGAVFGDPSWL
ncbi:MspA family porin [Nocardia sp. NPDC088792]|uniref:MspA family porin n=1 Tax=Nocardia sp. NPDC088792 TaxID=3364332 RepID=UPI0038309EC0